MWLRGREVCKACNRIIVNLDQFNTNHKASYYYIEHVSILSRGCKANKVWVHTACNIQHQSACVLGCLWAHLQERHKVRLWWGVEFPVQPTGEIFRLNLCFLLYNKHKEYHQNLIIQVKVCGKRNSLKALWRCRVPENRTDRWTPQKLHAPSIAVVGAEACNHKF